MNTRIKDIVINIFGYNNAWRLKRFLFKPTFQEIDIVYEYCFKSDLPKVMIDVGAHFGESMTPFLNIGWKVIAFEPDPSNFSRIRPHKRLILEPNAISDKSGNNVKFYVSEESSGISSLVNFRESHENYFNVDIKTLDVVISELDIKEVGFLKIDTEGNDLMVLRGLDFNKVKPTIILCEFEDEKTKKLGYDYRMLGDFLLAKNYTVYLSEWYPIKKYGEDHKWKSIKKYPAEVGENAWGNFIAVNSAHTNTLDDLINNYVDRLERNQSVNG